MNVRVFPDSVLTLDGAVGETHTPSISAGCRAVWRKVLPPAVPVPFRQQLRSVVEFVPTPKKLNMNTQTARMAGEGAYYTGDTLSDNPFNRLDDNYDSWEDGFLNAQWEDRFPYTDQDHLDHPT